MSRNMDIQEGMQVYGAGDQMLGRVEKIHGNGFHVAGQHIGRDQILRVEHNRIYLQGAGQSGAVATGSAEGEIRVPVVEEQLRVGKREVELGEVEVRRRVVEEQQSVPVTLRHEEVTVQEVDTPDRPLRAGEEAFQEGTIRVAVHGEEAVVAKQAVVTGEVVIEKDVEVEQRTVSDTVRKGRVDIEEHYQRARADFERDFQTRATGQERTFAQAEPNYRAGFAAAHDPRHQGRQFEEIEPELRGAHESTGGGGVDLWERLREEVRMGWARARR